ncbi:hypothetical protein, partial [Kistimonas scapharcae]|uniref:hypothetical protein n=1 Tax=Kistimonas scapharcae TaxID=1036133 RepID=UPI0031EF6E5A
MAKKKKCWWRSIAREVNDSKAFHDLSLLAKLLISEPFLCSCQILPIHCTPSAPSQINSDRVFRATRGITD